MTCRTPVPPVPAGISPEIAALWTEYFQAYAKGERDGATDEDIGAAGEVMEAAASRLALIPHGSPRDIAAKARLVIYVQDEIGGLTSAEKEIRASALAAVLAMAEDTA